jgi:circadian clock protein KaiC
VSNWWQHAVRHVQLRKTRGSGALSGRHECLIDEAGMHVYPRLESLFSHPSQLGSAIAASAAGANLDEMLGGGLAKGSVSLLMGPSGLARRPWGWPFWGPARRRRAAFRLLRDARTPA